MVRELGLAVSAHPHDKRWLSAASGLVCMGDKAYVIADDEHHLAHFNLKDTAAPVSLLQLFEGTLPRDKGKRKKTKPDLESLVLLPALELYPHGALLALGSGSKPNRCRATLLALDKAGDVNGPALHLDLSVLYAPLQILFGDVNIEGAFIAEGQLHLLQRGNKGSRTNARVSYDWIAFAAWLLGASTQVPVAIRVQRLALGEVDGVPLGLTDAAALAEGTWIFCAVAEDARNSYADGACVASVVGIVDNKGRINNMLRLQGNPKVEGIAVAPGCDVRGAELRLLLVTDADDPGVASQLLQTTVQQAPLSQN